MFSGGACSQPHLFAIAIAIAIAQSARSINSGRPWRWLTDADRVLREAFAR
jgi:hypothetical protein